MINRVRILITGLKQWKESYEEILDKIEEEKEISGNINPELEAQKNGLKQVYADMMQEYNDFSVEISEEEMISIMNISETPYLWFLRFVIKKSL